MNVASRTLKAALWDAQAKFPLVTPATSLRDYLKSRAVAARALFASGTIKSNSANGHVTEFSAVGISVEDACHVYVYLVDEFDRAKEELGGNPTDAAVGAQMESNLRPITGYTNDWRYLCPSIVLCAFLLSGCGTVNSLIIHPLSVLHQEHEYNEAHANK